MTAPAATVRQSPDGERLGDGYQTLVTFAAIPDVALWEKSVTPPGVEGDDPNDNTTMHNVNWRTKSPRTLATLTDFQFTAGYDPAVIADILTLVNLVTTLTVRYPNGGTLAFYGFLKAFEPDSLEEGKVPECTVTVVPTNQDPTTCSEEGPVWTPGVGTSGC